MLVSHPLFVDDSLIVGDVDADQLWCLQCCPLTCYVFFIFEVVSELNVNLGYSDQCPRECLKGGEEFAGFLGLKIGKLVISHLGVHLGLSYKARAVQDALMEWMERRLMGIRSQFYLPGLMLLTFGVDLMELGHVFFS